MGLFNSISSIFRGRDALAERTSGSAYSFFMGGSTSGKRVNERTAMQMTAVYSCVRILSEAVAGLPLQFYRYTTDGGKEKAVDHPLYFLLHDEPNPEMTSFVFRETLMTHLLLWGNAYSQSIRNARGEIIALYPLMPDRMTVNRDGDGQLYYEYYMNTFVEGYSGFLYLDKDGMPEVAMHWQHRFNHAVQRYNDIYRVQMPNITPHVCRHTYCSNMAKAGMNPKTLQYLMGHSDIGVTMNTYTHLGLEDAKDEMIRMEELNASKRELEKTTGEKPVTQKMFRVV